MEIPDSVIPYDADDNNGERFLIKQNGIATIPDTTLEASKINADSWYQQNNPSIVQTKDTFLQYIKARKKYTTLSSLSGDLSEITSSGNGIYYYDPAGTFTITTDYSTQNADFVLIVDGPVVFNSTGGVFNADTSQATRPSRRSIAILADSVTFASGSNYMTNANGVFIAATVDTGTRNNVGLKVVGNVVTQSLTNGRNFNNVDNTKPSFFVVVDLKQYAALLPYLSVSKYDWKQLQ